MPLEAFLKSLPCPSDPVQTVPSSVSDIHLRHKTAADQQVLSKHKKGGTWHPPLLMSLAAQQTEDKAH